MSSSSLQESSISNFPLISHNKSQSPDGHNVHTCDAVQELQNKVKRDPDSYKNEFIQQVPVITR